MNEHQTEADPRNLPPKQHRYWFPTVSAQTRWDKVARELGKALQVCRDNCTEWHVRAVYTRKKIRDFWFGDYRYNGKRYLVLLHHARASNEGELLMEATKYMPDTCVMSMNNFETEYWDRTHQEVWGLSREQATELQFIAAERMAARSPSNH